MVLGFQWLLWECFSGTGLGHAEEMRGVWVEHTGLGRSIYMSCLWSIEKPCGSKWQCLYNNSRKLLPLWHVHPKHRGGLGATMIEEFLRSLLRLMPGAVDPSNPTKGGAHPLKEKIYTLCGVVFKLELPAAIHLHVDVWAGCYLTFEKAMRSNSRFGDYQPPCLAHEMAVNVAKVSAWYVAALDDMDSNLPLFSKFIGMRWNRAFTDQMTDSRRTLLRSRAKAFLDAAMKKHLDWNARTWSTARVLLGILSDAGRARWFACELLRLLGEGADSTLRSPQRAPRQHRRRTPSTSSCWTG